MLVAFSLDLRAVVHMIDSGPHSVITVRSLVTSRRDAQTGMAPQCVPFVLVPMHRLSAKANLTLSVLTVPPLIPQQRDVSTLLQAWIAQ